MARLVSIFFVLCVSLSPGFQGFASADETITVKPGETVTLPCNALGNTIKIIDWSKDNETVCFHRDSKSQCEKDQLPPTFNGRVELKDPRMKDGEASLVLWNVTVNDTGTYQCRVRTKTRKRSLVLTGDPISTIILKVEPGKCVGQNCSGKDGGDMEKGGKDGGEKRGRYGLGAAGIIIVVVVIVFAVVVVVVIYRGRNRTSEHSYHQPAADDKATHRVCKVSHLFSLRCLCPAAVKQNHVALERPGGVL